MWNLDNFELVNTIEAHDSAVCSLAVGTGNLFSGSWKDLKVWDLETFKCVQTLSGHNHWVRGLSIFKNTVFLKK
jgi:WD40 repeat protein